MNEWFVFVMVEHGADTLAAEWRDARAQHWVSIAPIISDHCSWPGANTSPPGKIHPGANAEDKTASVDARECIWIVDHFEV